MKIALIGAPGSGKTHIARYLSLTLKLDHIECDEFFWNGLNVREEVEKAIEKPRWVLDGHITKVSDLVFPHVDKIIVIEGLHLRSLFRSIKRDWRIPSKAWFNFQNYDLMVRKRKALIEELMQTRSQDIIHLDNFPDLGESELAAFCEDLKTSSVKTKKKPVQRQRS